MRRSLVLRECKLFFVPRTVCLASRSQARHPLGHGCQGRAGGLRSSGAPAFGRRRLFLQEIRNPQDFVHSAAGHRAHFLRQHEVQSCMRPRLCCGCRQVQWLREPRRISQHAFHQPNSSNAARACRWPLGQCSLPRRRACPHAAQWRVPDRGRRSRD